MDGSLKLVVGLGNPGRKYAETRHNVGFDVLAELAARGGQSAPRSRFQGETVDALIGGQRVLLLWPLTYMNKSGESVRAARDFYKIADADLLVVCDDFNLPLCQLRFRGKGSSGGQKGLQNIVDQLGTQEFARLRFGIDPPPANWDVADYVLSKFKPDERKEVDFYVKVAGDAVAAWVAQGIGYCMNKYNAAAKEKS